MFSLRPSAPLTLLERFLSGFYEGENNQPKKPLHEVERSQSSRSPNGLYSDNLGELELPPSGNLLEGSGSYNGFLLGGEDSTFSFVCANGEEIGQEDDKSREGKGVQSSSSCSTIAGGGTNVVKRQWTAEEDSLLIRLVKQHGIRKWSQIANKLVGRIGKQCRERWHNHLRPDIKKEAWSEEEERQLVEAHKKVGNRWAEITKQIPGRTENSIKNHWYATKRSHNSKRKSKRKAVQGERPQTSILQEYIKSKVCNDACTTNTTPSISATMHKHFVISSNQPSSSKSGSITEERFHVGVVQDPCILDFSGFDEDEDHDSDCGFLIGKCTFLASPPSCDFLRKEAIAPTTGSDVASDVATTTSHKNLYSDTSLLNLFNEGPSPSIDVHDNSNAEFMGSQASWCGKPDMDLMEMVSWQLSHSQSSSC